MNMYALVRSKMNMEQNEYDTFTVDKVEMICYFKLYKNKVNLF